MAQTGDKTTAQRTREAVQFFLVIFGAALGFYQFVYVQIYVPSRRPPAVTLAATLEELDRADGMVLVRSRLVVRNPSDTKVWVPALWWNVYGLSFSGETRTEAEFAATVDPLLKGTEESFTRYSSIRRVEVVANGRVPDFEYWYQPKDETNHEQLFLVPEGEFDILQIVANADITKSLDNFAPTRWAIDGQGTLTPTLLLKAQGWSEDHQDRVTPFLPGQDKKQRILSDRSDAGQNVTTASLRIKPAIPAASATKRAPLR
jgi:hypothetical protein